MIMKKYTAPELKTSIYSVEDIISVSEGEAKYKTLAKGTVYAGSSDWDWTELVKDDSILK